MQSERLIARLLGPLAAAYADAAAQCVPAPGVPHEDRTTAEREPIPDTAPVSAAAQGTAASGGVQPGVVTDAPQPRAAQSADRNFPDPSAAGALQVAPAPRTLPAAAVQDVVPPEAPGVPAPHTHLRAATPAAPALRAEPAPPVARGANAVLPAEPVPAKPVHAQPAAGPARAGAGQQLQAVGDLHTVAATGAGLLPLKVYSAMPAEPALPAVAAQTGTVAQAPRAQDAGPPALPAGDPAPLAAGPAAAPSAQPAVPHAGAARAPETPRRSAPPPAAPAAGAPGFLPLRAHVARAPARPAWSGLQAAAVAPPAAAAFSAHPEQPPAGHERLAPYAAPGARPALPAAPAADSADSADSADAPGRPAGAMQPAGFAAPDYSVHAYTDPAAGANNPALARQISRALEPVLARAAAAAGATGDDGVQGAGDAAPRVANTFNIRVAMGGPHPLDARAGTALRDALGDWLARAARAHGIG